MKVIASIVQTTLSLTGIHGALYLETSTKYLATIYGKFKIEVGDISPFKIIVMNRYNNDETAYFHVDDVKIVHEPMIVTKVRKEIAKVRELGEKELA